MLLYNYFLECGYNESLLDNIFFNNAYNFLSKNNIKVKSNIYVINNDSFKKFTNWFVSRYNNRIEYKTILELIRQEDNFNNQKCDDNTIHTVITVKIKPIILKKELENIFTFKIHEDVNLNMAKIK